MHAFHVGALFPAAIEAQQQERCNHHDGREAEGVEDASSSHRHRLIPIMPPKLKPGALWENRPGLYLMNRVRCLTVAQRSVSCSDNEARDPQDIRTSLQTLQCPRLLRGDLLRQALRRP